MPDTSDRLTAIETILERMERRLFGNGQPGELEALHDRITQTNKEVNRLKQWQVWVTGAAVGVGTLLGYILR